MVMSVSADGSALGLSLVGRSFRTWASHITCGVRVDALVIVLPLLPQLRFCISKDWEEAGGFPKDLHRRAYQVRGSGPERRASSYS